MTVRQRLLKSIYPLWMLYAKLKPRHAVSEQPPVTVSPSDPIYDLSFTALDGREIDMKDFAGKKILVVNTASDCVYTSQYADLQALYNKYKGRLTVIAFPSNEFKQQEKGSAEEIADFCSGYGLKFPVSSKSFVRKGSSQHPVFQWLTTPEKNGWNSIEPGWNFSKYLLDEKGNLTHVFGPAIPPLGRELKEAINK